MVSRVKSTSDNGRLVGSVADGPRLLVASDFDVKKPRRVVKKYSIRLYPMLSSYYVYKAEALTLNVRRRM